MFYEQLPHMRIFITGANGQLAKSIIDLSPAAELFLATKENLDVTNKLQVEKSIKNFKPDIIFHFASMTRGDECAKDPQKAHLINVIGTENVVEAAKAVDASVLFVSTNEVFDGKRKTPYKEGDKKNPITVAGKTKHQAEEIIQKRMENYYIIRTSWLFSKWSTNFLHAVIDKAKSRKKIILVHDEVSSPTYSKDLAEAILKLIQTKKYGIYHLVNEGIVSRLDFAKKAFAIEGINDVQIEAVSLKDFERLSKPPLFSALKNSNAAKLHITLPPWEDAVKRFLSENKY